MTDLPLPIAYPLPVDLEDRVYRVFPPEIEQDDAIFFHGTNAAHLSSILENGFIPSGELTSISFARESSLALRYASLARTEVYPDGCIIAVRYDDVHRPGLRHEPSILYDDTRDPPPVILGYCLVPSSYRFF